MVIRVDEFINIIEKYDLEMDLKIHMKKASVYAELLAKLMDIGTEQVMVIKKAALLHDIGKKLIDDNILYKPGKLTTEEFEQMKKHSELGLKLLKKEDKNKVVINSMLYHHEKWNGKGYPLGLYKENIPLEARIISIVDCYEALTSKRVYKNKISHEEALDIIKSESGTSFDPNIVSIFEKFEKEFKILLENPLI